MKSITLLTAFSIFLSITANAQLGDPNITYDGSALQEYQIVAQIDLSADSLYQRVLSWASRHYSASEIGQSENQITARGTARGGAFKIRHLFVRLEVLHNMIAEVRDGRVRITLNEFYLLDVSNMTDDSTKKPVPLTARGLLQKKKASMKIIKEIKPMLTDLIEAPSQSSDW